MTTSSPSKRTATQSRTKKSTPRKRPPKSGTADDKLVDQSQTWMSQSGRRLQSGLPEQLLILVAAIAFGLVGLFIHILVIVSIVLMALLLGLLASEARIQRGRGIVSEVVNEAKTVLEDIKRPGEVISDDGTESGSTLGSTQ